MRQKNGLTSVIISERMQFDSFLNDRAFVGYETPEYPFTAVFGAEKGHPFVKDMLDYYNGRTFEFDVNDQLKAVNTKSVSDILIQDYGCKLGNKRQTLREDIEVYTEDVLCNPSANSVSIHVFTGTWMEGEKPLARKINTFLKLRLTTKKRAGLFRKYVMKNK